MNTFKFRLVALITLIIQIYLIGISVEFIAEGKDIAIHASCIAANLFFGAMNICTLGR